jgi:hypothetical protein
VLECGGVSSRRNAVQVMGTTDLVPASILNACRAAQSNRATPAGARDELVEERTFAMHLSCLEVISNDVRIYVIESVASAANDDWISWA